MSNTPGFSRASHLSIVWGVALSALTLLEWRALDRDPIGHRILTPFIEREVTVTVAESVSAELPSLDDRGLAADQAALQYEVEIGFNGPLFLACFFGPVLAFQGIGWLATRARPGS